MGERRGVELCRLLSGKWADGRRGVSVGVQYGSGWMGVSVRWRYLPIRITKNEEGGGAIMNTVGDYSYTRLLRLKGVELVPLGLVY